MAVASNTSLPARSFRLAGGSPSASGSQAVAPEPEPVGDQIQFGYTLSESAVTSAAVHLSGVKVRDLWSNVRRAAGSYTYTWDGKDDFGNTIIAAGEHYDIRVLGHNVGTKFHALFTSVANPSGIGGDSDFGDNSTFCIAGSSWVKEKSYTEGTPQYKKATLAAPNTFSFLNVGSNSSGNQHFRPFATCSDGTTVFAVGGYPLGSSPHRMGAEKYTLSTGARAQWTSKTSDGLTMDTDWDGAAAGANFSKYWDEFGINSNSSDHTYDPSDCDVQITGNYFAYCIKESDLIVIKHKTTGATIATLTGTVTDPSCMCWGPDEGSLWVGTGTDIKKLEPAGGDWTDVIGISTIATGQTVCDLARSTSTYNRVAAALGSHQIKVYNGTTNAVVSTIGASGGYASTTVVADNRFHFYGLRQSSNGTERGVTLDWDSDDKLYVFQKVFQRCVRFADPNSTPTTIDSGFGYQGLIPYQSGYEVATAGGTRFITNNWMLWERDWSVTVTPGDLTGGGAWSLVGWYGYAHESSGSTGGITRLWEGAGGRLYGVHYKADFNVYEVELTSTTLRECALIGNKEIYIGRDADGNRYRWVQSPPGSTIIKDTLTGYDGSNNPTYSSATFANIPADDGHGMTWGSDGTQFFPLLADGSIVCMKPDISGDPAADSLVYHVGQLKSTGWTSRHALTDTRDRLPVPNDGRICSKGANGGSSTAGQKDLYVLSAQGEGTDAGQAGVHNVYDKYGLFWFKIGRETPTAFAGRNQKHRSIGENGNAQSIALIYETTNNTYHYCFSDENQGMVQEFEFDNLASAQYLTGSAERGETISLGTMSAVGGGPSVIGAAGFTEIWDRADSSTIGNSWTEVGANLSIVSNLLKEGTGAYNAWRSSYIYRNPYTGATASNVCAALTIPANSFFTAGYTRDSGSQHDSQFGIKARLNAATGLHLGVVAAYRRNGDGDDSTEQGNGYFTVSFVGDDGTNIIDLGTKLATALPGTPGNSYKLFFAVTGTQPTRMWYALWDETLNELVLEDYTENWDTAYESAGKVGMHLGMELVRASRFEELALNWTSVLPPVR